MKTRKKNISNWRIKGANEEWGFKENGEMHLRFQNQKQIHFHPQYRRCNRSLGEWCWTISAWQLEAKRAVGRSNQNTRFQPNFSASSRFRYPIIKRKNKRGGEAQKKKLYLWLMLWTLFHDCVPKKKMWNEDSKEEERKQQWKPNNFGNIEREGRKDQGSCCSNCL